MANMGRYCKAYLVKRFREFDGWSENLANLRKDRLPEDSQAATPTLNDDDHLYLQENLVVTDGIFIDENVVFDQVTPEWREFTASTLNFAVPDYLRADAASAEATSQGHD